MGENKGEALTADTAACALAKAEEGKEKEIDADENMKAGEDDEDWDDWDEDEDDTVGENSSAGISGKIFQDFVQFVESLITGVGKVKLKDALKELKDLRRQTYNAV